MAPSDHNEAVERGWIIPVGGAEERIGDPTILRRFVRFSGEKEANIVIIPTASQLDDTGSNYEKLFKELGAKEATSLPYKQRSDTDRSDWLKVLSQASGVWFTGGNQLRLSTILGGTEVMTKIRRMNASGVPVGGTSAGAAILPEHMIAHGQKGDTPTAGMVSMAPGLGLTNRFVVDQHFRERGRMGRLLTALSYNPFAVGRGIDEDTAAFISPDNRVRVVGSGAVTVIDVSKMGHSSIADAPTGAPLCITGVQIHVLPHGSIFDLESREAFPPS